MEKGEIIYTRV